jgi:hypothetical protein
MSGPTSPYVFSVVAGTGPVDIRRIACSSSSASGGGGGDGDGDGDGLTWIKLLLTDFSDARDAGPVLSAPATQDADGLITWPCNAPNTFGDLRECASKTMPIADLATIVGLSDASTLINGSNVIHLRMTCDIGQKNVGIMASYLDRPATNQASAYGVGVGCFRNTSNTNPKLTGAIIHESSTIANGSGAALLTQNPYCTGTLQHPIVRGVNHYGGHVSIWEYDDPAWVKEGGISYTRELDAPGDLVHFGIAAWFKASGGIPSTMTTTIEVAVQSSAEWAEVSI